MPIVDIELVTGDPEMGRDQLQPLVDQLGSLFGSEPGATWVRLRSTDRRSYAENDAVVDECHSPTFVNVLRHELPDATTLRREMAEVAGIVARNLDRPQESVHVPYSPEAKGRIGFGGKLV